METKTSEGNKDSTALQYYVIQRNTILISLTPNFNKKISPVLLGTLVAALEPLDTLDKLSLRLRVYDFNCDCEDWRNTEWKGHPADCIPVSPIIWQYLAAVKVPNERVRLASDKLFCEYAKSIHREDKVWYHPNGDEKVKRLSVVKYIGKVPELGHGLYFGLDLVEPHEDSQTSELTKQYFNCVRSKGTFATLADISLFKKPSTTGFGIDKIITKNDLSTTVTIKDQTRSTNFDQKQHMHDLDIAFFDRLTSSSFDDKKNNNRDVAGTNSKEQLIQIQNDVCAMSFSNKHTDYSFPHSDSVPEKNELKKIVNREENTKDLQVGLNVKVLLDTDTHNGIIRWIGTPDGIAPGKLMAAVELDDGHPLGTDGTYEDVRYFKCRSHNAVFTDIDHCLRYDKMLPKNEDRSLKVRLDNYGNSEDSVIVGAVRPICVKGDLETMCGKDRGIQGHHNSCYLDATLFSMFTFTSAFDNLLFRPPNEKDCPEYEEVQRVLREEIVNPLRKKLYVHSDRVMKLRTLLEKLSSVSGLTSEEKDPEEFLTSLVAQILNAEPFLKLSSGQDAYHYQLFVEKDDDLNLPTVQQLLEQSFLTSNIRLKEVPSCLIIQMPRFGKSFKMYQKIQPTLLLDVTDIIEDSPRHCTVCGKLAEYECKECYGQRGVGLESIAFCSQCLAKVHQHERRTNHEPKKLSVPLEFTCLQEHCPVPRLYLELSAVVCIETSHYVSFVKCGSGSDAPWCFFDSMADRKGEQNGYNIPEMVPCSDFPYWLSEEGADFLKNLTDDRNLPEHAKRLLCDAYMCMYQSPDVMMYK